MVQFLPTGQQQQDEPQAPRCLLASHQHHGLSPILSGIHYDYSHQADDAGGQVINVEIEIPIHGEFEIVSFPFDVAVEDPLETAKDLCSAYEVGVEQVAGIEAILVEIQQSVHLESIEGSSQGGLAHGQHLNHNLAEAGGGCGEVSGSSAVAGGAFRTSVVNAQTVFGLPPVNGVASTAQSQHELARKPSAMAESISQTSTSSMVEAAAEAAVAAEIAAEAVELAVETDFFASLGVVDREALELEVGGGIKFEEGRLRRLEESMKSKEEIEKARIKKYNDDHMDMAKKIKKEKLLIAGKRRKIVSDWKQKRETVRAQAASEETTGVAAETSSSLSSSVASIDADSLSDGSVPHIASEGVDGTKAGGLSVDMKQPGSDISGSVTNASDRAAPAAVLPPSRSPLQPPPQKQEATQQLQQQQPQQKQFQQQQQLPQKYSGALPPAQQMDAEYQLKLTQQQQQLQHQHQLQQQQHTQPIPRVPQAGSAPPPAQPTGSTMTASPQLQVKSTAPPAQQPQTAVGAAERQPPSQTQATRSQQLPPGNVSVLSPTFFTPAAADNPPPTVSAVPRVFDPFSDISTQQQRPQAHQQVQQQHHQHHQHVHQQQQHSAPPQQHPPSQTKCASKAVGTVIQQQQQQQQQASLKMPAFSEEQKHSDQAEGTKDIATSLPSPSPPTPANLAPSIGATSTNHLPPNSEVYRQQQQQQQWLSAEQFSQQQPEAAQQPLAKRL